MIDVGHPCVQRQHPQPDAFKGKVCLLINGRTFSTAADVASIFRSNKRSIIIGSETGGGYEGNTSGASERVELNNSHIKIQIPRWYYENAVAPAPQLHRGTIPDYAVKKKPTDLFDNSKDPELDLALKMLNE
jgi:C-terminal processing protease CtpA/Prc